MLSSPCSTVTPTSNVYKDECIHCFHSPSSPGGLFICVQSFLGFCSRHVVPFSARSHSTTFLHLIRHKCSPPPAPLQHQQPKVAKLAIEDTEKEEWQEVYSVRQMPDLDTPIPLDDAHIAPQLLATCTAMVANEGVFRMQQLTAGVSAWDGEAKINTKHAQLLQLPDPPKVPPTGWKCSELGCDLTTNLWLNLSDGSIKCGRRQYLSQEKFSEGRNHMSEHYQRTKYPLAVKLGTITCSGDADVYSYDEDESVIDPNLAQHLKHFGVDIASTEKTEKTTLELELDLNQKWEYNRIQEAGTDLELMYGPGYTGIVNLGSSCYMNATLQTFCLLPDIVERFGHENEKMWQSLETIPEDFNAQMSKVIRCLESGDYSQKPSDDDKVHQEQNGIKPVQFRRLVGRGHPEFSTAKQQDAEEYIRYLLEKFDAHCTTDGANPSDSLRFDWENRFVDVGSGKVRYSTRSEVVLPLPIVLDEAVNKVELAAFEQRKQQIESTGGTIAADEVVRPRIPFASCLRALMGDEQLDDFLSPITGQKTGALQRLRFATFPDFLLVQAKKFTVADDWTPKKLDVELVVPDRLDLEEWRAKGVQSGEQLLPEDAPVPVARPAVPVVDGAVVEQLVSMGFPASAARKAALLTNNTGLEAATEWIMMHMDDPDFAVEHPQFSGEATVEKPEAVDQLVVLGFTARQARHALQLNEGDANRAAEWLFINGDQLADLPEEVETMDTTTTPISNRRNGTGKYRLIGFISHMGSNTHCGHYVCHLLKDGKWVLYNDEKVAISQKPPTEYGYIYLFKRED